MALHTKYRPKSLEEVEGNDVIKAGLTAICKRKPEDMPHSFLFQGPKGCGKTTFAGVLRRILGCEKESYLCYNASNTRGIDTIREIDENCQYGPVVGNIKVYLLDEAHKLTNDAENALLKALEEPPPHVYFILCTTEPEKILGTIKDRCSIYTVRPLTRSGIVTLLEKITAAEQRTIPKKVLREIAKISDGSARKSLVVLDAIIDLDTETEMMDAIIDTSFSETDVREICQILLGFHDSNKWEKIQPMLRGLRGEPEQVRYGIMNYLEKVLLGKRHHVKIAEMISLFMPSTFYTGKAGLTYAIYVACKI
jgi:DNA polymerase-3 subunit gamma/tau